MNLKYLEIEALLNKSDLSNFPIFTFSVLRNLTIEPIETYLRYYSFCMGYNAKVIWGGYDNVFQEAMGQNQGLLSKETDCILIFLTLRTLSHSLFYEFTRLSFDEIESEVLRIKEYLQQVLKGIRMQSNALILWHAFEMIPNPVMGVLDDMIDRGQNSIILELNRFLSEIVSSYENIYLVNTNLCLLRIGEDSFYDRRYWHIGKAPYSKRAIAEIANEGFKIIRALKGKNKKCIVLDCDNTLWGGIVGEDGIERIKISDTYPGSFYKEFQTEIFNLCNRGILIALCSKNNPEDVWEVFKHHPDMVIKEQHITLAKINWNDKASNIKAIASELNIGLDSIVFVDDSEFEADLVRRELPEVEVILLPKDKPYEYSRILRCSGFFDSVAFSDEDRSRTAMYRAEVARKHEREKVTDLDDFYRSLKMKIQIKFSDDFSCPRIAQLTQKTNQFNLTTIRYSESDIRMLMNNPNTDVVYLKLADKFGDSGIVGVAIVKYENHQAIIESFLLSCRVLGRKVEEAFLLSILRLAKDKVVASVIGKYVRTKKNSQTEYFYEKNGFVSIPQKDNGTDLQTYEFDLGGTIKNIPVFFELTDIDF